MLAQLQTALEKVLTEAGVPGPFDFSVPPKPEMGDVAFPCFNFAKAQKKNPALVAKELAQKMQTTPEIERVEAFGPYVNFFLRAEVVVDRIVQLVARQGPQFGSSTVGKGQKVMIEYPSNNTHKEFHIGHFRTVCIGNTLVQLYGLAGFEVFPVNYLNDFGSHVAKCLWGINKFHAGEVPPPNKQKWLGEIYVEANRYLKEHEEAMTEVGALQNKLEAHDDTIWPQFEQTRQWSIDRFEELFAELKVRHVAVFYEKDIKGEAQKMVDEMLKQGIAQVGEGGAIIIDLTSFGLDIALLRKSNGAGLYLTSDLPLAEKKFKKFDVDESIIITGLEQTFYFKQLFKILELMGFHKKLTHIGYGLVELPGGGKMSSRAGGVILYEDLRDKVYETLKVATRERHADWSDKQITETAFRLTMAALKFDMQKHESVKNFVFDINEATSVEGFSGPYILYVVARINSLLRKAKEQKIKPAKETVGLVAPTEKRLALLMGEYQAALQKALSGYNPSVMARYAFDLAQAFNDFYNQQPILNATEPHLAGERLALCQATCQVLTNALGVLTIEPVVEM